MGDVRYRTVQANLNRIAPGTGCDIGYNIENSSYSVVNLKSKRNLN